METKEKSTPNKYIRAIVAIAGLLFSGIFIIKTANESKLYNAIANNTSPTSPSLAKKIQNIKETIAANQAIQNKEYEQALAMISGTKSKDYYNRGTIETLLAYQNALQNTVSGLQTAQIFLAQAENSFQIAEKLNPPSTIQTAIKKNMSTIETLAPIVDIKTCYNIGSNIIQGINEIDDIITTIKTTLEEEDTYLQKRAASIDVECKEMLFTILENSKEQVTLLDMQMAYNYKNYTKDLSEKIEEPTICLDTPYENIIPSLEKGKVGLVSYQELHQNTVLALKNNNKQDIKKLCERTKNDAQINQNIENSVQELLQKLNENTTIEQVNKKATQDKQHKDFFTKEEQQILKEIQETNKTWIENILKIRGKGNYNPQKYIDDMFNQFYGNPDDFIDLHK